MGTAKKKGRFRFIKVLFIILNFVFVFALLAAYLCAYISPAKNSLLPFFGLAYPILVLANLVFLVIWLFARARWALLSLLTILLGWNHIIAYVQYSKQHSFAAGENKINVLSYNVRNFDIYNYSKDWKSNCAKRDKIFRFLKDKQPDILCFQEFVNDLSGVFKTKDTLVQFLDAKNVHAEYTVTSRDINQFGIATFTVYPIAGQGRITLPNSPTNLCIYTDVLIDKDTVRIYNAHFESIHFSKLDYEYTKKVTELNYSGNDKKGSRRIFDLLRKAFADRASQVLLVEKHISACRYPVILCTDLNDTPCSYAYYHIAGDLKDAFIESGNGFGHTYAQIFPSFRIDYIFHDKGFKAYNFRTLEVDYSDHHPMECEMVKKTKE
jgi:endonuclease/exonuclease/phosphatase family metal-dependent hydrolase